MNESSIGPMDYPRRAESIEAFGECIARASSAEIGVETGAREESIECIHSGGWFVIDSVTCEGAAFGLSEGRANRGFIDLGLADPKAAAEFFVSEFVGGGAAPSPNSAHFPK